MSHQAATGTLDPTNGTDIQLTIECAYGQSIQTKVDYIENGQISDHIISFNDTTPQKIIASYDDARNKEFRVFCTVNDVQDPIPGEEVEDIEVTIRVICGDSIVERTWAKSTQGTGGVFTFSLDVFTM